MITTALCAIVITSLWLRMRGTARETGLWALHFWLQFVALLLIVARGAIPDFISMVVGNTLVTVAMIVMLIALERYLDRPGRQLHNYAFLAAFLAVHTYFSVIRPDLTARNINTSVAIVFMCTQMVWLLAHRVDRDVRTDASMIATVYGLYALLASVRIVLDLTGPTVKDMFRSALPDTLVLLSYQMLLVALTFALVLMVNRRVQTALERDVVQRRRAEEALRLSEQKFSIAFANIPDAIIISGISDGIVIEVNETFCEMVGLGRDELIGRSTIDLALWSDRADRDTFVGLLREHRRVPDFETAFRRRSGETFPGSASGEVIEIDGAMCALTVIHDLTTRKRAEAEILRLNAGLEVAVQERTEELYASNEELYATNEELASVNEALVDSNILLGEATRAKSEFLAAMSHELRTPLNSIIGFSGIMLQGLTGTLNLEQSKQLGMINNSGRHLLELINEVLDLARVESGQSKPTFRDVDVCALALDMFETVRPMAEVKGVEMRWECPEGLAPVRTDGLYVTQILLNLVGNAVKFTEVGHVDLTVAMHGPDLTVAVEDTGCGIEPEDLSRIFEDFYQVTPRTVAKSEGTGLGLAVSRRLADAIGARIEVTSEVGHGSVFTLRLPVLAR